MHNSANMSSNKPFDHLSPAEQDEYRRRFPRAGFWLGALPPPADLAPYYRPHVGRVEQAAPGLMGPGVPPHPNWQHAPAAHPQGQEVAVPLVHAPVVLARMLSFLKKPLTLIFEPQYSMRH